MAIIPLNAHKRTWLAIRRRIDIVPPAEKVLFPVVWCSMEGVVDMVKAREDVWEMGIVGGRSRVHLRRRSFLISLRRNVVCSIVLQYT